MEEMVKLTFLKTYNNIEELGFGGFGTVYSATRKTIGSTKTVAVKMIPISKENNHAQKTEKAKKEYLLPKDLQHPNVVRVLNYWTEDPLDNPPNDFKIYPAKALKQVCAKLIFIEFEFADLGSLLSWFDSDWRHPTYIKNFFYQITCGLIYLHENRIIHRDLKPENILLFSDPITNGVTVKIGDFGISTEFRKTMTSGIGTSGFIAPEVVTSGKYSPKADVYALGMIYYELCIQSDTKYSQTTKDGANAAKYINSKDGKGLLETDYFNTAVLDKLDAEDRLLVKQMSEHEPDNRLSSVEVLTKFYEFYQRDFQLHIPGPLPKFRLHGDGKTFQMLKEIPLAIRDTLVELDLKFIEVNAERFTSSLETCRNLSKISMVIRLEQGKINFKKLELPRIKSFFLRLLNVPKDTSVNSEGVLESIYFIGSLEKAWVSNIKVRIVWLTSVVIDISHSCRDEIIINECKDVNRMTLSQCHRQLFNGLIGIKEDLERQPSIYNMVPSTEDMIEQLNTNRFEIKDLKLLLKRYKSVIMETFKLKSLSINSMGFRHIDIFNLKMPMPNQKCTFFEFLESLSTMTLTDFILYSFSFANLRELNVSFKSNYGNRIGMRHIPESVKRLTLCNAIVDLNGISEFKFEKLWILRSTFKNLIIENEDVTINADEIVIYGVNTKHIFPNSHSYKPTWSLLNKLIDSGCKQITFGNFNWDSESSYGVDRKALTSYGILENHEHFSLNLIEFPWKGKTIYREEENQILNSLSDKFKISKDEDISISLVTKVVTQPELFSESTDPFDIYEVYEEYKKVRFFDDITEHTRIKKICLENVIIDPSSFFIKLKKFQNIRNLTFKNIHLKDDNMSFQGNVRFPQLKVFNFVLDQRFSSTSQIENYFSEEKVKTIFCFNNSSFSGLWTSDINILIVCYKNRILELDHCNQSIFIGHISYADNILKECGVERESRLQKLTLCETRLSHSLPPFSSLTALSLFRVDVFVDHISFSELFPNLKSFLFQPSESSTIFDLASLPSKMEDVRLCGLKLQVSKSFVCDKFSIWECEVDGPINLYTYLSVKELEIIADDATKPNLDFLLAILTYPRRDFYRTEKVFLSGFDWDSPIKKWKHAGPGSSNSIELCVEPSQSKVIFPKHLKDLASEPLEFKMFYNGEQWQVELTDK